jgi:hypothetical protein
LPPVWKTNNDLHKTDENGRTLLGHRKAQIESVIDEHLKVLGFDQKSSAFMNYDDKLQYLLQKDNEAKLKTKEDRLRMKGVTLSYDLYES